MKSSEGRHATERFSNRVEHYVRSRPSYPAVALDLLEESCGSFKGATLADIGCGTGILANLLLDRGAEVIGIEPNAPMREAGERLLKSYPGFHMQAGTAESTGLNDESVDGIAAAQAFHWFDPPRARAEFVRILRPGGFVALLWNTRVKEGLPFQEEFEQFVQQFSIDYNKINHSETAGEEIIRRFFAPASCLYAAYPHQQLFDFDGLLSRVLSSSFMPDAQHPQFPAMREALQALYRRHAHQGRVSFDYKTEMYFGRLTA